MVVVGCSYGGGALRAIDVSMLHPCWKIYFNLLWCTMGNGSFTSSTTTRGLVTDFFTVASSLSTLLLDLLLVCTSVVLLEQPLMSDLLLVISVVATLLSSGASTAGATTGSGKYAGSIGGSCDSVSRAELFMMLQTDLLSGRKVHFLRLKPFTLKLLSSMEMITAPSLWN